MKYDNNVILDPELPKLELITRRIVADLETETREFRVSGRTLDDAKEGIIFLLQAEQQLRAEKSDNKK